MPPWRVRIALAAMLTGLYLLMAGGAGLTEMLAAIPAVALAFLASAALRARADRQFALRASWMAVLLRPLAAILPDALRVGTALLRPGAAGAMSRQAFDPGGADPQSAGRRALVTLGVSLAPNGYVVAMEEGALRLHRLVPAAPRPDRAWPL